MVYGYISSGCEWEKHGFWMCSGVWKVVEHITEPTGIRLTLILGGLTVACGLWALWPKLVPSSVGIPQTVRDTLPLREQTLEPISAPGLPELPTTSSVKPLFSGPLNLNSATREQVEALPGVGPVLAGRILAARPYRTLADLDAVKGVGETTLKRLEPFLTFR